MSSAILVYFLILEKYGNSFTSSMLMDLFLSFGDPADFLKQINDYIFNSMCNKNARESSETE
jgi:hypothetical protein